MQVTLNQGLEFVSLESAMSELKLTPEALEVPVPAFLVHQTPQVCPAAHTFTLIATSHSMAQYRKGLSLLSVLCKTDIQSCRVRQRRVCKGGLLRSRPPWTALLMAHR